MRRIRADLHIHTVASPCAASEMTPEAVVQKAMAMGLEMIAICDHNTTANTAAMQEAAGNDLAVFAGMEITSCEEAHVVGIFPALHSALNAGREVAASLLAAHGARAKAPLPQVAATLMSLDEVVAMIHGHGGLAIAAHVDRPSFSVLSQLGIWPNDVRFDAAEISAVCLKFGRTACFKDLALPLLAASDSHSLDEIGCAYTDFMMRAPEFDELKAAFKRPLQHGAAHA